MRNRILVAVGSVLCVVAVAAPAQAVIRPPNIAVAAITLHGVSINRGYSKLCDQGSAGLCARDPSDGGPGTFVKMSGYSGDLSMKWGFTIDTNQCNGGFVTTSCPDATLGRLYSGKAIIYYQNQGSGDCLGANSGSGWVVLMKTCGFTDTLFIFDYQGTYAHFASVEFSNSNPNQVGLLCGSNAYNVEPEVLSTCSPLSLAQWVA